jgi:hypothetical protein
MTGPTRYGVFALLTLANQEGQLPKRFSSGIWNPFGRFFWLYAALGRGSN